MEHLIEKIHRAAYCDYSNNISSKIDIEKFSRLVSRNLSIELDQHYLDFLSLINELHGYFKIMVKFFDDCLNSESEIVLIATG